MVGVCRGWNNHETESNKEKWIQSVRWLRYTENLSNLNTLAREVERCGCNEGNSSQGDAFNVFVLFVNWLTSPFF